MKTYKVFILPSAYEDIKQARQWYRQHNSLLPKQFTQQLRNCIDRIISTPFAFAIRYKDVHMANMNVFPYVVHYLIDDAANSVFILAVHHSALSPDKWQLRLK